MINIYNTKNKNMPLFLLFCLSLIFPGHLLLFWKKLSFSLFSIDNSLIFSNNFFTFFIYGIIILITIFLLLSKPYFSIILSRFFGTLIIICFLIFNFNINISLISHLLLVSYLILMISTIVTFICFFHHYNIWKIFIFSTIVFAVFNFLLSDNPFFLNTEVYKPIIIILFLLFNCAFYLIKVNSPINENKLKDNKVPMIIIFGTIIVIMLTAFLGSFAMVFSTYIKHGGIVLYGATILSILFILILNKKFKVDTFHIINVYISISFVGFILALIPNFRLFACFFLAFGLVANNLCCFLGNTLFNSYKSKFIILFVVLINILIPILTLTIFDAFKNNIQFTIIIFLSATSLFFLILFTFMPFVSSEYKKDISDKEVKIYFEKLSKRENEIVKYLLLGYTSGQLTKELYISLPTVKTHISNIYKKLEINSKKELFEMFNK